MIFKILLFCIALPLLDLILTVRLGARLGVFLPLEVVFTFLLGIFLYRTKAKPFLASLKGLGLAPGMVATLGEGVAYLLASALLIFPGILTDGLALVLLLPKVRRNLGAAVLPRGLVGMMSGFPFGAGGMGGMGGMGRRKGPASGPFSEGADAAEDSPPVRPEKKPGAKEVKGRWRRVDEP